MERRRFELQQSLPKAMLTPLPKASSIGAMIQNAVFQPFRNISFITGNVAINKGQAMAVARRTFPVPNVF